MPVAIGHVIDAGLSSEQDVINRNFIALFALAALAAAFAALRFYLVSWVGERVVADLRQAVFQHVLQLSPSFFEVTRSEPTPPRAYLGVTRESFGDPRSYSESICDFYYFF